MSALSVLSESISATQSLLSGPGARGRWREFTLLAAMAGIVGAGAPPPPVGLLLPLRDDPAIRAAVFASPAAAAGLWTLAVALLLFGPFGRSFTLAFQQGILTGAPDRRAYRPFLARGAAHFAWSSLICLPLYLLLFTAEVRVAEEAYSRLLAAPEAVFADPGILLAAAGRFLLVVAPWTLLTLPAMVIIYELTPAAMLRSGEGPVHAWSLVWSTARKRPKAFAGYLGIRLVLQAVGNAAAAAALFPCLAAAGLLSSPALAAAWSLQLRLGGLASGPGAGAAAAAALLSAVVLYVTLCAALVPVSVLLHAFALRVLEGSSD